MITGVDTPHDMHEIIRDIKQVGPMVNTFVLNAAQLASSAHATDMGSYNASRRVHRGLCILEVQIQEMKKDIRKRQSQISAHNKKLRGLDEHDEPINLDIEQ